MTTTTSENLAKPGSRASSVRLRPVAPFRAIACAFLLVIASFAAVFVSAQESTPDATPTSEITPTPDMPRIELTLEEFNDSGIGGSVTLYDAGDQTIVEYDVEGAGGDHPTHIHNGVCGELDPEPAFALDNVEENGNSTTVVDITLDDLLAEDHAIDMHLAPNELGTLIACVNITGEPEVPDVASTPAASPEATPSGDATATPEESDGTGGAINADDATETAVSEGTETPVATEVPVETEAATERATSAPTEAPTPEPTAAPVEEPATPEESDGTGGAINEDDKSATLPLFTLNDSGVTGTAALTGQGDQTMISILLSGDAVTGNHAAHLHDGTCAAPGDYTLDLNPVNANGISETLADLPLANLLNDGYFINVHPSQDTWDVWFVCGELGDATLGMVVPEVAPDTGGGEATIPAATTAPAAPAPTPAPVFPGDGTSGVSGKGEPIDATSLPQQAGVGASLPWPDSPAMAIMWASTAAAILLAASAWPIRRGEHQPSATPSRWSRLGL